VATIQVWLNQETRKFYSQIIITKAAFRSFPTPAIDHVRYRFYWESYIKNPTAFMKEIEQVANTADKYGIKVIYDNPNFTLLHG
jgi:O-acetylhomoserine/O-acetylserine sulfhydrylase-like pyridoxal-dependent enzyme